MPMAAEAGGGVGGGVRGSKLMLKPDVSISNKTKLNFLSGLGKPSEQAHSELTGEG